ncbi:MAG: AEC family transporter [Halioglobus sp.]
MAFSEILSLFYTSLAISLPTFGWVVLGLVLARAGALTPSLNDRISNLSFRFCLPVMLFSGAAQVDYRTMDNAVYLLAGVLTALLVLGLSWVWSRWRGHTLPQQGIFVQAAFRSNLAIIGLALAVAAYGDKAAPLAALPVAVMTVLYNVLAVWVLNVTHGAETGIGRVALGIARNPLVLGISAGMALSLSPLQTPALLEPVGRGLSAFFLPLMLVCIGGSMDLSRLYRADVFAWEASAWRLVVSPTLGVLLALAMGVRGESLGVLFLLLATPMAVSAYVMVVAARGDGVLAANITVLSTLLSIVTITGGFFLLSLLGLVGELQVR